MKKIPNRMVSLKANVPYSIHVQGGIDCFSEIRFRVPRSTIGKMIYFFFKDADRRELKLPIKFVEVETHFLYGDDLANLNNTKYGSVELLSGEDLNIEVWSEENEAVFF